MPSVQPIWKRIVKYVQLTVALALLLGAGALLGEKSVHQKDGLAAKRDSFRKENEQLVSEIRSLEREVMLLRSDPNTIEKVAKKKLGMSRTNETVYVFDRGRKGSAGAFNSDAALNN